MASSATATNGMVSAPRRPRPLRPTATQLDLRRANRHFSLPPELSGLMGVPASTLPTRAARAYARRVDALGPEEF